MRQQHAPVARRLAAQRSEQAGAVAAAFAKIDAQPGQQPGRQQHGKGHPQVEPRRGKARQNQRQREDEQPGDQQSGAPAIDAVVAPARNGPQPHKRHQQGHQRHEHRIEVRRPHRVLALPQGIHQQREQGAEQHGQRGDQKHHVIDQQQGLARHRREADAAAHRRRAQRVQGEGSAHHQGEKHQDKQAAGRVRREGVHRGEDPRAHQKSAQQTQREGKDRQQHGPAFEQPALLGNGQGMQQGGAGQPGHKRGVFHRVPEPPAAPAQFVVGPPTAEHNAQAEEGPGHIGPGPRPARPGRVQTATEQRGDGKGKGHAKTHVAHIQQRRMHDQPRVLQQRIQIVAVRRHGGQQAGEGIGGKQRKGQKAHGDGPHHRQHARQHNRRQAAAEARHRGHPQRQDQHPQQQRALVVAPQRGELVDGRQQAVAVGRHHCHRKIVAHKGAGQTGKTDRAEHADPQRQGRGQAHRRVVPAKTAPQRNHGQTQGHQQGEDQRQMSDFGNHRATRASALRSRASATSGGM